MDNPTVVHLVLYGFDGVIAVAYTDEGKAEAAAKEIQSHTREEAWVRSLPLNPESAGHWLVRLGPDMETLLCEPDFFPGGEHGSRGFGDTTGKEWEGGAQGWGRTVEEAKQRVQEYMRNRSRPDHSGQV